MSAIGSLIIAGQSDIRQRLNSDGLAALGLAGPLLSQAWTQTIPTANVNNLSFTVAGQWYAPISGMLITEPSPEQSGLSRFDGTPWPAGTGNAVVFRIHPQARLRLERLMVANLQAVGAIPDRSIRPVPSVFLITNPAITLATPWIANAAELVMPGGDVTCYDDHGLAIDIFAFAAAIAAILQGATAAGAPMPAGNPAGIPAAIAQLASAGNFVHAIDLHGRPWKDPPGASGGISLYTGGGLPTVSDHIGDGLLHAWQANATLAAEADPTGAQSALTTPALTRFGWHPQGRLNTMPLTWPTAGAQTPTRDTLRVVVCDPVFHLLGNRTANTRDFVGAADAQSVAEQAPILREGSPITLFPDGRSGLGWIGQVILGLQGGNPNLTFTSGPIFAVSPFFDDAAWPFPAAPGPAGAWPQASPTADPVPGNDGAVLQALAPLRSGASANWIAGTNDVLFKLPSGLPKGVAVRVYPIQILMTTSPDEQPLLKRVDGDAIITTGGANDTIRLRDPFVLGPGAVRPANPKLRMDAAVAWVSNATAVPRIKLIANLHYIVGADVPAPSAVPTNILGAMFWRGIASNPLIGVPPRGSFTLSTVFGDPVAFVQGVVRTLSTDANPREAPRLPTMSRNECLFSLQLPPALSADLYRSLLTGGWLTREADAHSYRLANPGAVGWHEVHSPSLVATGQIGFDLWVAAAHRARPVAPTADTAAVFQSGPNANVPSNWVLLQANATSVPPGAPAAANSSIAAAVLQTVPAFVETPELAVIPDDDVAGAVNWVTTQLGNWLSTPNDTELHRQIGREIRTAKYGRRDAQWSLRRAIAHARELIYIETPLLADTAHDAGAPQDSAAAVNLISEIANRLTIEPRLRVVILVPRDPPFVTGYEPFSAYFLDQRLKVAQTLNLVGGTVKGLNGPRPRVVIAHPMGIPGRPLVMRSTTVIVDDVWCLCGTSSISRRGLTFDGANDVVIVDWQLDRGASVAIRTHRKALMAAHLGVGPAPVGGGAPPDNVGGPNPDWVRLHNPLSAHEAFADALAAGNRTKIIPLWPGPDPMAPGAVIAHPADVADPDGGGGATLVTTIAAAIGSSNVV